MLPKNIIAGIVLTFLIQSFSAFAQNVDSLRSLLKKTMHDTSRVHILNEMVENESDDNLWPQYNAQMKVICEKNLAKLKPGSAEYRYFLKFMAGCLNNEGVHAISQGLDSIALKSYFKSLKIDEELGNKKGMGNTFNNIASLYSDRGNSSKGLFYNLKALKLFEEIKDPNLIAISHNNIGLIYKHLGDIGQALEHYHLCLNSMEQLGDKSGIGSSLNNIASLHKELGNRQKSIEYYQKGLEIFREIDDKDGVAHCLNSLGSHYSDRGDYTQALNYLKESAKIFAEIGRVKGYASTLNNLGFVYKKLGEFESAMDYYQRGLELYKKGNYKSEVGLMYSSMAIVALQMNKLEEAISLGEKSYVIAKELGYPDNLESSSMALSVAYAKQNNFKKAYEMQVLYKQMSDSVLNQHNRKTLLLKSFQYTYDKKAAQDSIKKIEERKVFDAQIAQEKTQKITLFIVMGLIAIFSIFIYNRFRLTRRQKRIIELQKTIVEEKQKEILDSIRYAKRIQTALLPGEKYIDKVLNRTKKG